MKEVLSENKFWQPSDSYIVKLNKSLLFNPFVNKFQQILGSIYQETHVLTQCIKPEATAAGTTYAVLLPAGSEGETKYGNRNKGNKDYTNILAALFTSVYS